MSKSKSSKSKLQTPKVEEFRFTVPLRLARTAKALPAGVARVYEVTIMAAGETKNGITLPDEVLSVGAPKFEGVGALFDHPGFFDDPSVSRLVGVYRDTHWNAADRRIDGELHMLAISASEPAVELLDAVIGMQEAGQKPPDVGISALVSLPSEWIDGKRVAVSIREAVSADIVYRPAAGGKAHRVLNSTQGAGEMENEEETRQGDAGSTVVAAASSAPTPVVQAGASPAATPAQPDALGVALQREQCRALLDLSLSNAGLPAQFAAIVRDRFTTSDGAVRVFDPADLEREIASVRSAAASFAQGGAIQGMGHPAHDGRPTVQGMWSSRERIEAAYERLMGLPVASQFADVPRLRGLAELYTGLTGDVDMRGIFRPEYVRFAVSGATSPNTSAVMAELTANLLNKLALVQWQKLARAGYEWWRRAVIIRDFPTLQPTQWIVAGGFGDLPTVADGGVYTELVWDDKREVISFLNKGGYTSLTLRMIDMDDIAGFRAVPEALATSAIRTISAAVSSVFTDNPTLNEDSAAMFSTARGNLIAYDLDVTGWEQAGIAMYTATEFNSSKRLATLPDRVIVPIQKRRNAIKLFFGDKEPGGSLNDLNVAPLDAAPGGPKDSAGPVLVSPDFTDTNDWVALANPDLAPAVGCGFRFGDMPEIFSVADPNSFLLFFQDAMPIKVRWFYAVGAVDFRSAVLSQL